jgi:hypothetical protein
LVVDSIRNTKSGDIFEFFRPAQKRAQMARQMRSQDQIFRLKRHRKHRFPDLARNDNR